MPPLRIGNYRKGEKMLEDIRAVIFDLDGTLVDSMWMWRDIDIEYLSRRGIKMPENLQEEIAGISVTQTARYFKETFNIQDSIETIIREWDDLAYYKYQFEVPLKDGVLRWLEYLKKEAVACAIATSNSSGLTRAVLKSHKIEGYFQEIITGEDIHNGKPEPDIYIECARRLEVDAHHCLVFEDIPHGIIAAKRAGMRVCAIEDDYSAKDKPEKKRLADYYIRSYDEIFEKSYEECV